MRRSSSRSALPPIRSTPSTRTATRLRGSPASLPSTPGSTSARWPAVRPWAPPRSTRRDCPTGSRPEPPPTDGGRPVADDVARLLACDPALHAVIVDTLGRPLDVGTSTRFATPRLRRGAHTRDGGCVFPGCEIRPAWTDLHHVVPFPTGPTDLDNLACLCRHHHRVSHRHGWSMHATDDGWFWWRTPTGRSFWSQRHGSQRVEPPP